MSKGYKWVLVESFEEIKGDELLSTSACDDGEFTSRDISLWYAIKLVKNKELFKKVECEWYENIPEHGVLCWVSDDNVKRKKVALVLVYAETASCQFCCVFESWVYATPLTDEEIKQYLRGE